MITEVEERFVKLIAEKGFDKEEVIALSLVCRHRNIMEEMLGYLEEHPDADFDELLEKSIEGLEPLKMIISDD